MRIFNYVDEASKVMFANPNTDANYVMAVQSLNQMKQ